jgi:PAS domain S-box-containing protein
MAHRRKARRAPSSTLRAVRRRLQEAEDTLAAIREGHVDALVMRAGHDEQVFTLRSADQPYRLMVEQMHEGAVTLGSDGAILYCNARFAEIVGSSAEALTGQPFHELLDIGDRVRFVAVLRQGTFRDEFQITGTAGVVIPVQLSATALMIDDLRTTAVVISDLTQERSERALRESNRLKDEFLATLSHELRTPLNVILGWTHMLRTDRLEERAIKRALELIDRNAKAQSQIVNDLVDMSRMFTGKMRLDPQHIPLVPLLQAAVDAVRPSAKVKNISIEFNDRAGGASVFGDPTRLQQVVWNLLTNAVKFTPPGGRIRVTTSRMGDNLRIEVADTGIGIDPAFVPHVFDRFRQGESGTTRTFGGLGLGLAIVQDLVHLHGGTVEASSAGTGKGARFVVVLPVGKSQEVAPRARALASRRLAKDTRVLVVEDHDDSRELAVQIVESAGASVVAVASVDEALDVLARKRISVVVADIGLPDQDGYSLVRQIRAHRLQRLRTIPVIAVTAYVSASDRERTLAMGFHQHVAKPADPVTLIDAIARAVASRPARRSASPPTVPSSHGSNV